MGCAMSIEERELRSQLGAALDQFVPGQVPMPALVRQAKGMVTRRRLATIAAVASLIITAAVVAPLAMRHVADGRAPTSPTNYTVTQHSARLAHPLHISYGTNTTASAEVGFGTVNARSWWVKLSVRAGVIHVTSRDLDVNFDIGNGNPPLNSRSGAFASLTNNGGSPVLDYGIVRADVAYLRVKLTNGQVLTVRPVDVFGQRYARYVAFAVPYDAAVTELIAYSARAELGYAIPFTRAGEFWNRWNPAGLPAPPAPASYLIGSGVADRAAWSVHLDVGPWGTCQVTSAMRPGFAVAWCPVPGLRPGRVAQILHGEDPLDQCRGCSLSAACRCRRSRSPRLHPRLATSSSPGATAAASVFPQSRSAAGGTAHSRPPASGRRSGPSGSRDSP